ncbi:Gfo/Idh/MocA family oxidoreductase, partial [Arthrobacter sp.]|uniref:Gfo/Idh/MocA family protein n=1 Tax=Arthrobacter sp. TaxID=1667 RepID=UPI00339447A8
MSTNSEVQQSSAAMGTNSVAVPRIALVGVHGYGARHLINLRRLQDAGTLELVAVADPRPPSAGELDASVAVFAAVEDLLAAGIRPDIVIAATPIHTHTPIALAALSAGADVYLEKPAAGSLAQYQQIVDAAAESGRAVQVGFQSLGSQALAVIEDTIGTGRIGEVRGISATGLWVRDRAYFKRSRWAGKRTLDGVDVVDGVATNPLAHAVATALRIAGARGADDVAQVETDLYHAHEIEGDDTSVIRIRTSAGSTVLCALTLCAQEQSEPFVTVHGTEGELVFYYTSDVLETTTSAGMRRETFSRTDLLENLLAHRSWGEPLLSSIADSGAFMRVLEQIRTSEPPAAVDPTYIDWVGEAEEGHPVI